MRIVGTAGELNKTYAKPTGRLKLADCESTLTPSATFVD